MDTYCWRFRWLGQYRVVVRGAGIHLLLVFYEYIGMFELIAGLWLMYKYDYLPVVMFSGDNREGTRS